jgi:hypothetical protein
VFNVRPNLADHVDFLIGGTVVNAARPCQYNRALYWEDDREVVALRDRLTEREIDKATRRAVDEADKAAKPARKRKK